MRFIYSIVIRLYYALVWVAQFSNSKAKLWIKGRENWRKCKPENIENCIWIHASSLGEFEQGRPIIERIKKNNPKEKILLTFYSPSGFEIRKNYEFADLVMYLPIDTQRNAKEFIKMFKPKMAIFIKYEYWFNFIYELHKEEIPIYTVSAIFRPNQHFFKWYGAWFRKHLRMISHFYVQDKNSLELLSKIKITQTTLSGDTRFDRVFENSKNIKHFPEIEHFIDTQKCLIVGSSWEPDEKLIFDFLKNLSFKLKVIIAPHQVDENHITKIEKQFAEFHPIRLSRMEIKKEEKESSVLIVDSIGKLMHLYQYADFVYVGGGFGSGIHNILEPATFGKPVFFGPNYQKFIEAKELIELGGAFSINNSFELISLFEKMIENSSVLQKAQNHAHKYILNKKGATDIIVKDLFNF